MNKYLLKILATAAYVGMIFVNYLANALPLNGRSTGAISDAYANLFTPAGVTFSIWGLIYLLLGAYAVYQFISKSKKTEVSVGEIAPLFIGTSLANMAWIFAWHYDQIGLSVLIMAGLLFLLIKIADVLRVQKFNPRENFLIRIPFSIYFGWITVATIANITVFLVSLRWDGFGLSDYVWTVIILLVGALIGILRLHHDRSTAYGLVLVWAYLGILLKHALPDGFGGQYPGVIMTLGLCLLLFGFFIGKYSRN